jgi:hypothetical protein
MLDAAAPGYRLKLVAGRFVDQRRSDEAIIAYQSARLRGVRVGDRIPFTLPPPPRVRYGEAGARLPSTLHTVGVYMVPSEIPPTTIQTDFHLSNALYRALPPNPTPSMVIRLRHGASDIPLMRSELTQMAAGKQVVLVDFAAAAAESRRSIQVQTPVLWVLAAVAGFTAVMILAQLIARHLAVATVRGPARNPFAFPGGAPDGWP